jgi:hypothetical protein
LGPIGRPSLCCCHLLCRSSSPLLPSTRCTLVTAEIHLAQQPLVSARFITGRRPLQPEQDITCPGSTRSSLNNWRHMLLQAKQ